MFEIFCPRDGSPDGEFRLLRIVGRLRFLRLLRVGRFVWGMGSMFQAVTWAEQCLLQ